MVISILQNIYLGLKIVVGITVFTIASYYYYLSGHHVYSVSGGVATVRVGEIGLESASLFSVLSKDNRITKELIVHIDSGGGLVSSLSSMISSLEILKSRGVVVKCDTTTIAASAAALLILECSKIKASNKAIILFHTAGNSDRTDLIKPDNHPFLYTAYRSYFDKAERILTQEEWEAMWQGEDIAISGKEFMTRLRNLK